MAASLKTGSPWPWAEPPWGGRSWAGEREATQALNLSEGEKERERKTSMRLTVTFAWFLHLRKKTNKKNKKEKCDIGLSFHGNFLEAAIRNQYPVSLRNVNLRAFPINLIDIRYRPDITKKN